LPGIVGASVLEVAGNGCNSNKNLTLTLASSSMIFTAGQKELWQNGLEKYSEIPVTEGTVSLSG
jgi:hypothetical protein